VAGTIKRLYGPAFLANAAANIYNNASASLYTIIRKMHFANVTAAAVNIRIYVGATGGSAAGTQLYYDYSIAANGEFNVYGALRLDSTDFLTGLAGSANAIVVTLEGELVPV
jgi:hypothetical protein